MTNANPAASALADLLLDLIARNEARGERVSLSWAREIAGEKFRGLGSLRGDFQPMLRRLGFRFEREGLGTTYVTV